MTKRTTKSVCPTVDGERMRYLNSPGVQLIFSIPRVQDILNGYKKISADEQDTLAKLFNILKFVATDTRQSALYTFERYKAANKLPALYAASIHKPFRMAWKHYFMDSDLKELIPETSVKFTGVTRDGKREFVRIQRVKIYNHPALDENNVLNVRGYVIRVVSAINQFEELATVLLSLREAAIESISKYEEDAKTLSKIKSKLSDQEMALLVRLGVLPKY